jgi:hypothetical protein
LIVDPFSDWFLTDVFWVKSHKKGNTHLYNFARLIVFHGDGDGDVDVDPTLDFFSGSRTGIE